MYSIQRFTLETMKQKGFSRSEIVRKLGYRNTGKGFRRLDEFIRQGEMNSFILENLSRALDESPEVILEKLRETEQEIICERNEASAAREKKERGEFTPYLFCRTERRIPSQIFVFAMLGIERYRKITLGKDFNSLPPQVQGRIIRSSIRESLEQHDGQIPTLGMITGFVLVRNYDERGEDHIFFNLAGDPVYDIAADFKEIFTGTARISMKGRNITVLLRTMMKYGGQ